MCGKEFYAQATGKGVTSCLLFLSYDKVILIYKELRVWNRWQYKTFLYGQQKKNENSENRN